MTLQFFFCLFWSSFTKEYPRIKVTVTNAPTETICSLEEGKIDFGVVTTPFSCKSTIHSMMVKPIGTVFFFLIQLWRTERKKLDYSILGSMPVFSGKKHDQSLYGRVSFCKRNGTDARV